LPGYLHITNEIDSISQIRDLTEQVIGGFILITVMQIADNRRNREKAIGICQHEQGNRRK
jgi:hypothetical protein